MITLNNSTYHFDCDMLALITFQRLTGKNPLTPEGLDNTDLQTVLTLGYAIILASNPADQVPPMEDFFKSLSNFDAALLLLNETSRELSRFFHLEKADQHGIPDADDEPDAEKKKQ